MPLRLIQKLRENIRNPFTKGHHEAVTLKIKPRVRKKILSGKYREVDGWKTVPFKNGKTILQRTVGNTKITLEFRADGTAKRRIDRDAKTGKIVVTTSFTKQGTVFGRRKGKEPKWLRELELEEVH